MSSVSERRRRSSREEGRMSAAQKVGGWGAEQAVDGVKYIGVCTVSVNDWPGD
jgi:hypothetical protein